MASEERPDAVAAAAHAASICVHADRCSGCPLIDRLPAERLARKRERVLRAAARFAALETVFVEETVAAPSDVAYRTRAKLMVGPSGELGLFARQDGETADHVVVDIPSCRVLAPALLEVAAFLRANLGEARDALVAAGAAPDGLRAVDLREVVAHPGADGPRVLVTLVVAGTTPDIGRSLVAFAERILREVRVAVGVALNHHDGTSPQVLGERTEVLAGAAETRDRVGEAEFPATFGAFVQAHREQAARVQRRILDVVAKLPHGARVLDVYGGSGVLALALAERGYRVTTVDSFAPALRFLESFAAAKGLAIDTFAGDAAEVLANLAKLGAVFDLIVVNPPRRGMHPLVREAVARLAPPSLVYVSCDPDTLARDLDHLALVGLAPATLAPFDLIPLTDEVETVAVLERRGYRSPHLIAETESMAVFDKPAHESTVPSIDCAAHLLARVHRLDGLDLVGERDEIERGERRGYRSPHLIAETESMAVFDKPAHESTVPSIDCAAHLLARVHRLDGLDHAWHVFDLEPGVSGAVVFGRTKSDALRWAEAFRVHETRRVYVALAKGISPLKGVVHKSFTTRQGESVTTRTRYRRLAVAAGHSLLRIVAEVGDPVALRRHMASIGHPLLGDDRFGHVPSNRYFQERYGLDRLFLHLVRIECTSPETSERLFLESQLAGDLKGVLERIAGDEVLRVLDGRHALGIEGFSSMPPAAIEGGGELPTIPQSAPLPRIVMPPKAGDSGPILPE